jgi:hypothetical protein
MFITNKKCNTRQSGECVRPFAQGRLPLIEQSIVHKDYTSYQIRVKVSGGSYEHSIYTNYLGCCLMEASRIVHLFTTAYLFGYFPQCLGPLPMYPQGREMESLKVRVSIVFLVF